MRKYQISTLVWLAVAAAIPLVTQAGCANNEPAVSKNQNTATPVKSSDPCRQGPVTRKSAKESFSDYITLPKSISAAQCISICKQEFTKRKTRKINYQPLVTLERLEASNCNVEYYPHSPQDSSSYLRCDVDYTATHSPYTCPKPPQR